MVDLHERRMSILRRVEAGELNLEDGNRLLVELEERSQDSTEPEPAVVPVAQAINTGFTATRTDPSMTRPPEFLASPSADSYTASPDSADPPDPDVQPVHILPAVDEELPHSPTGWRPLWIVPFLLGLFLTMVSVNWMYLGWAAAGLGWGFWLSFFPLALGIGLMWVGWELRAARWLHLRIRQAPGDHPQVFAFSLPLPMGLTRWAVQHFGKYSPQVNGRDVGEFLDEFDQAIATDGPMHVYVDDRDGQQVEIWIEGPKKK